MTTAQVKTIRFYPEDNKWYVEMLYSGDGTSVRFIPVTWETVNEIMFGMQYEIGVLRENNDVSFTIIFKTS